MPIQRVPSRATRDLSNILAGELLTRWRLPGDGANTIEAIQAEFRAQPQIAIRSLRNRDDRAFGKAFANLPRGVRVLADVERGIERESASAARQQDA